MESRVSKVNELRHKTGVSVSLACKCLALADYEMELAMMLVEYYSIAVNKSYPVGRVIRDYWMSKAREEYW
jgi:translation elongation factor EF-Ts